MSCVGGRSWFVEVDAGGVALDAQAARHHGVDVDLGVPSHTVGHHSKEGARLLDVHPPRFQESLEVRILEDTGELLAAERARIVKVGSSQHLPEMLDVSHIRSALTK